MNFIRLDVPTSYNRNLTQLTTTGGRAYAKTTGKRYHNGNLNPL